MKKFLPLLFLLFTPLAYSNACYNNNLGQSESFGSAAAACQTNKSGTWTTSISGTTANSVNYYCYKDGDIQGVGASCTTDCEAPYIFDSPTGTCTLPPNDCPSGQTLVNGSCVPDVYCPSLAGTISSNLNCPPEGPSGCPGGTASCGDGTYGDSSQQGQDSGTSGTDSSGNSGGSPDNGCGGSGCGSSSDARSHGGASGSDNAVQDMGQRNGMPQSDIDALRDSAAQAAQGSGASGSSVSSNVMGTCMQLGYSVQTCGEMGIAAGNGYESGGNNSANEWQWGQDGGAQGENYICTGQDCGYLAFGCPPGYQWNGDSQIAQCVPATNSQPCMPTTYNGFCSEVTICQQQGGVWRSISETCYFPIAVNECPENTTLVNGRCETNIVGTPSCQAGSVWTGTGCQFLPTGTSTTINNTDGSTTTTYHYNTTNNYTQGEQGEGQGAGECDPTASDYAQCIGHTENVSDTYADDIKNNEDQKAQTKTDQYEQDMLEFLNENQTLDSETGVIENMLTSVIPTSGGCTAKTITVPKISMTLSCDKLNNFKVYFGWFLYVMTVFYLFHLALTPIESKV